MIGFAIVLLVLIAIVMVGAVFADRWRARKILGDQSRRRMLIRRRRMRHL